MAGSLIFLALLGAAVGSFLTLIVDRWAIAQTIWAGRSHCDSCKNQLRWWEMIPLLGYFIVKGKCSRCHKPVRYLYPVFELISALVFVLVWIAQPADRNLWYVGLELVFVSSLLVLLFHDWLTQTFPSIVLYFAFALALVLVFLKSQLGYGGGIFAVRDSMLGWLSSPTSIPTMSLAGFGVGVGFLGLLAGPSRGKWMGYGDVWVGAILGLWLGYPLIIVAILMAFYAGAIMAGFQILSKKIAADHRLAFGPFLLLSGIATRTYGDDILRTLLRLWGAVV